MVVILLSASGGSKAKTGELEARIEELEDKLGENRDYDDFSY